MSQIRSSGQTRFTAEDSRWMLHSIRSAAQGRGHVEPNPMVGATLVADGKCVGEGWHEVFGGPHAEINALTAAGSAARGSTLYVNLEPCCHHGKTPPCTDAIIKAGVSRVVCAMVDPFEQVNGKGIAALAAASVQVDVGCMESQARQVNGGYLSLIEAGRPLVLVKWAQTLDGKISSPHLGRYITSDAARVEAHRIRATCQGVMVGVGTVTSDDPLLTCRSAPGNSPHRYVLDGRLRTPASSQIVETARQVPVTLLTTAAGVHENLALVKRFKECGVEVLELAEKPPIKLVDVLKELGRQKITYLLVEGGRAVIRSVLTEKLASQAAIFIASKFAGPGLPILDDSLPPFRLDDVRIRHFGSDVLMEGRVDYV